MRQSLTIQDKIRVACYCAQKQAGWVNNPNGPGMVCSHCGHHSSYLVIRECDWCGNTFHLPMSSGRWRPPQVYIEGAGVCNTESFCFDCEPEED